MVQRLFLAVTMVLATMVASCGSGVEVASWEAPTPAYRKFPSFLEEQPFDVGTLALTVNHNVRMGETAALGDLRQRAARQEQRKGFVGDSRIDSVARILWGSSGKFLRNCNNGSGADLPGAKMSADEWPYFPMARSGDSFFMMSNLSAGTGVPESLVDYLNYCQREGRFRSRPLRVPTRDQALRDLDALKGSPKWRALSSENGFSEGDAIFLMKGQIPPADPEN